MNLLKLKPKSSKKRKRVGRGNASGHGTYSCRGMKGQSARAGGRRRPGFEGGQTPYLRKMPKLKGFKNPNYIKYQIINIGQLNIFDNNSEVKKEDLLTKNLISKKSLPVKLLSKGELEKKITITVDKASKEALKKAEKGGATIILTAAPRPKNSKKDDNKPEKEENTPKETKLEPKTPKTPKLIINN